MRVLDVGCGFGQTLAYHAKRGCDAHGIDADENLLRVAERYGLNARVGLFKAADYPADSFDYVTLDQVIEHSAASRTFLVTSRRCCGPAGPRSSRPPTPRALAPGCSVTDGSTGTSRTACSSSRASRSGLAAQCGLEVVPFGPYELPLAAVPVVHLFAYPDPRGCRRPSGIRSARRCDARPPARIGRSLYRARLFHLVTRTADAMGRGDNFLCMLRKPA